MWRRLVNGCIIIGLVCRVFVTWLLDTLRDPPSDPQKEIQEQEWLDQCRRVYQETGPHTMSEYCDSQRIRAECQAQLMHERLKRTWRGFTTRAHPCLGCQDSCPGKGHPRLWACGKTFAYDQGR